MIVLVDSGGCCNCCGRQAEAEGENQSVYVKFGVDRYVE